MLSTFSYMSNSKLSRVDARIKIVCLFAFSIGVLAFQQKIVLCMCLVFLVGCLIYSRLNWRLWLKPLIPILILAGFAFVFSVASHSTSEGVINASFVALRMILLVLASFIVCLTTSAHALMKALTFFIEPLRRFGVPIDEIAYTLSLSIRFIPLLYQEFVQIKKAQFIRGSQFESVSLKRKLANVGCLFMSLFIRMFRQAQRTAQAMDARAYGLKGCYAQVSETSMNAGRASRNQSLNQSEYSLLKTNKCSNIKS